MRRVCFFISGRSNPIQPLRKEKPRPLSQGAHRGVYVPCKKQCPLETSTPRRSPFGSTNINIIIYKMFFLRKNLGSIKYNSYI